MNHGAAYVQKRLRQELENYILSQYFGKSPILLDTIREKLDDEGLLYQKPYIESSPAYQTVQQGIKNSNIAAWAKDFFMDLSADNLGVFPSPYKHQVLALENAAQGKDLFVATGTGSGKTECFMWPLLQKLTKEAREKPKEWQRRGVRAIIMYPMNALVSDQVSRLRRLLGDPEEKFVSIFRKYSGSQTRRPQFGMYTGRTPYPGPEPRKQEDQQLVKTLSRLVETGEENPYLDLLQQEGKIPAKKDLAAFLAQVKEGVHSTDPEDTELITRFEMRNCCPDILITNYSMLEYMLLRDYEQSIWNETKNWLDADPVHKLLFIIDEAHMYRGSSGGEVALLLRRLFYRLGITRERVQFILTTASMPKHSAESQRKRDAFFTSLTAADTPDYLFITGEQEAIDPAKTYELSAEKLATLDLEAFEKSQAEKERMLLDFWEGVAGTPGRFASLEAACNWMYDHVIEYRPFQELFRLCRGEAISLDELTAKIFPEASADTGLSAINSLLAMAPLARNKKGMCLFPARMHMLFRGINGVYACVNDHCPHSHTHNGLTLGEVLLDDNKLVCPVCHSPVYELYNDRRCGALFFKGYVLESEVENGRAYLWKYPGQLMDQRLKAIHLYIPPEGFSLRKKGKTKVEINPCYMDVRNGFLYFDDDSKEGQSHYRKFYYSKYVENGRPKKFTFIKCPHCQHQLSLMQLTSFRTRGNQSFNNLIDAQFFLEPPVAGKEMDPEKYPNAGRKVLLFSDSRQRAAKLARDMSEASETEAIRKLFMLAIRKMQEEEEKGGAEYTLNDLYSFFCLVTQDEDLDLFTGNDRKKFQEQVEKERRKYARCRTTGRHRAYKPDDSNEDAVRPFQIYLLKFFSGGYNTFYDMAEAWLEPTEETLDDLMPALEEEGISIPEEKLLDFFNAWLLSIFDKETALGYKIDDSCRAEVRPDYGDHYGLSSDWKFDTTLKQIMDWKKSTPDTMKFKKAFQEAFLKLYDNNRYYLDMSKVKPKMDPKWQWYRCEQCAEMTPYPLKECCPFCGSPHIHPLTDLERQALKFWQAPIDAALEGEPIRLIDTEEHTAQLSHKDQRDNLWSKTEEYELRFQDLVRPGEKPVDILSSTTTMEVGIDIGSLVAVGLRNIPPMRENYQQRAGRAGRRGASLSTIVTYCDGGPHDTQYFQDPRPMFRGDPRQPWIDLLNEKLIYRHLNMVAFASYMKKIGNSLDQFAATEFCSNHIESFDEFMQKLDLSSDQVLFPKKFSFDKDKYLASLHAEITKLYAHWEKHPELYGTPNNNNNRTPVKSLLDALYERGIIPTYSFPKNVVSTYIQDEYGKTKYEVQRGLDTAINEYAPGRSIVVDKQTYQIGGLYYPGSEWKKGTFNSPASGFLDDPNYLKNVKECSQCGWFGLAEDSNDICPFCGSDSLKSARPMLRPWGFAPRDGKSIQEVQLQEEYTNVQQPIYSTVPTIDEMKSMPGMKHIRFAPRKNQKIIMVNTGVDDHGFQICEDCGAIMPGDKDDVLKGLKRPYHSSKPRCQHTHCKNVDLGFDFVTDMLVMEFYLDPAVIDTERKNNLWLKRAAQSLAEALRLVASQELDIEFTELMTGYRVRNHGNEVYVDIYLYDTLSSGAGYATSISDGLPEILEKVYQRLKNCDCDSACQKCLKHYRNQHIHGLLDRFAALDLLEWGRKGVKAAPLSFTEQKRLLQPLLDLLKSIDYQIDFDEQKIYCEHGGTRKELVVYPAMWRKPQESNVIFVSKALIQYAKPYALDQIEKEFL